MSESLDEFFEKTEARRQLVENLRTNLEVMLTNLDTVDEILRLQLIMIRQFLQEKK